MTKPDHYREVNPSVCSDCKHCYQSWCHCSACAGDAEYSCKKHDFLIGTTDSTGCYVCDDFEKED